MSAAPPKNRSVTAASYFFPFSLPEAEAPLNDGKTLQGHNSPPPLQQGRQYNNDKLRSNLFCQINTRLFLTKKNGWRKKGASRPCQNVAFFYLLYTGNCFRNQRNAPTDRLLLCCCPKRPIHPCSGAFFLLLPFIMQPAIPHITEKGTYV